MDIQKLFEELYVKNAPSWSIERDLDSSYKYHAIKSAFVLFENQQLEIESLKSELAEAQAVPYESCSIKSHEITINETKKELIDGYDFAQEDEYLLESLVYRGVCIGKAQAIPKGFVLVPKVITNEWMATYVDQVVSDYCKDYEDLPFAVDESELPELKESFRLPIRNAHKHLMKVIEAQEQSHE